MMDAYKNMNLVFMGRDYQSILTGYKELDDILNGLRLSDLIVISSEPGEGKTTFALTILKNISLFCSSVVYFNLSGQNIEGRLFELLMGESKRQLLKKDMKSLCKSYDGIKKESFYVENIARTLEDITIASWEKVKNDNIRVICIDHLQCLYSIDKFPPYTNKGQLHYIVYKLKELARQLNIPIILLSENIHEGMSGYHSDSIVQCGDDGACMEVADVFIKLSRPEVRNIVEDKLGNSLQNKEIVEIKKNRNGACGSFTLNIDKETGIIYGDNDKQYLKYLIALNSKSSSRESLETETDDQFSKLSSTDVPF